MKKLLIPLMCVLLITACSKNTPPSNTSNTSNNTSGTGGGGIKTGLFRINVTWSTPSGTVVCPVPVFVKIELSGQSGYSFTKIYGEQPPIILQMTLVTGSYDYKVTKYPNSGCSSFPTLTKTGTVTITTNGSSLSINLE